MPIRGGARFLRVKHEPEPTSASENTKNCRPNSSAGIPIAPLTVCVANEASIADGIRKPTAFFWTENGFHAMLEIHPRWPGRT